MAELPDDCYLVVLGEVPRRAKIEEQVRWLGLENRIDLIGAVDQATVFRYMVASDPLLIASLYGWLSHVVIEAMHARLPVAVSDVPENRDLVRHGETGVLILPGHSRTMRQAIDQLHDHPEERADLAHPGKQPLDQIAQDHRIERLVAVVDSVSDCRGR